MKELEKIKVGDYVRTTKKGIFKIISIEDTPYKYKVGRSDNENIAVFTIGKGGHSEIKSDIVDFSSNILDLIKVGDYINGEKIIDIQTEYYDINLNKILPLKTPKLIVGNEEGVLRVNKILSIVTKEQFESMEYRLEE